RRKSARSWPSTATSATPQRRGSSGAAWRSTAATPCARAATPGRPSSPASPPTASSSRPCATSTRRCRPPANRPTPSPPTPAPAARRTLVRRLSLVLTGLPPRPEDVEAFVTDESPTAYARLVDRLLASPHYGERWARHWLDVVRYAETHGFEWNYEVHHAWR